MSGTGVEPSDERSRRREVAVVPGATTPPNGADAPTSAGFEMLASVVADHARRTRRDGVLLVVVGVVFGLVAVVLLLIGQPLSAIVALALAVSTTPLGVFRLARPHRGPPSWYGILGTSCFVVIGLVLLVGGLVVPEIFGHRQVSAVPIGIVTLVVAVPAFVLFVWRAARRSSRGR
ncbi:hypothetical protein F8O01_14255 [Pseudoclavibacter chungangensis]|uniref:Uncharacterized protein n=1 Tax=Pseudoclavibacter chungangensis TaxID=587635 RepID=A0A7J5BPN3_9MICO|nr:hypothetical protein [Pseudoclavibacter chungangensis]KAB1654073.1 hypothetical protein F8O01_14255 [Pseudoclavibacter chungangensis]NYJ66015.1 hypothetical protein [Pseudoclavibacter chungangensis]